VFRAKRADRVKLLLWDGTGLVLVAKRLEKSSFRWPRICPSSNALRQMAV
jgi:transposase